MACCCSSSAMSGCERDSEGRDCHAVQAHEGIEQLKLNLKKEHDLKVDYMTAVWINVSCSPHTPKSS